MLIWQIFNKYLFNKDMGDIAVNKTEAVPGFQQPLHLSGRWIAKDIQVSGQVVVLQ